MVAVFQKSKFLPDDRVQKWCLKKHSRPLMSLPCEHAGNRGRRLEELGKTNEYSVDKLWETIVKKRILSGIHKFGEIDGGNQPTPRNARLPKHLYKPAPHHTQKRINLRQIVGTSQTPPWPSPGASALAQPVGDLLLTDHCIQNDCLDQMRFSWLCGLVRYGRLLIRVKDAPDKTWYFTLSTVNDTVALCTPALEKFTNYSETTDVVRYFLPDLSQTYRDLFPITILDGNAIEAIAYEWQSPAKQVLTLRPLFPPELRPRGMGIFASPALPQDTLYRVLARRCFDKHSLIWIRELGKQCVPGFKAKEPLFPTLRAVISFFLHEVSEEDLVAILVLRTLDTFFNQADFDSLEGCGDVMTKDEHDKAKERIKAHRGTKAVTDEHTEVWSEYRRKVHKLPERADPDPNNLASPLRRYKGESKVSDGDLTQPVLAKMFPPDCHIWESTRGTGSWSIHFAGYPRWCRPFVPLGCRNAALACLQYGWVLWLRDNRLLPKHCPATGVFDKSVANVHQRVSDAVVRGDKWKTTRSPLLLAR